MAEADAPSRERPDDIELNIPPDEVETQGKRAFVASGLGWGLDGFDLYGALGQALPDLRRGQSHGTNTMVVTSGEDPRSGHFYAYIETLGGGGGGGPESPGVNAVQVHITNTSNLPVESLELEYPLQVVEYGLIEESEGAGAVPGGRGIRRRIRILSDATVVEYNGTRLSTSPRGGEGAEAGGQGRCWVERPGGEVVDRSGEIDFPVEAGDVVGVDTPGGGGFG